MNNKIKYLPLACMLMVSSVNAASIVLKNGNLESTDKVDIMWSNQSGTCPGTYPTKSANCRRTERKLEGVKAPDIIRVGKSIDAKDLYSLTINLAAETKKAKHYLFNEASCSNLQKRLRTSITINTTGCVIR